MRFGIWNVRSLYGWVSEVTSTKNWNVLSENLKGRYHPEDLGKDERIILE